MPDKAQVVEAEQKFVAKPHAPALNSGRLKEVAKVRREWEFTVPHGIDPTAILEPSFYRHEAGRLQPRDILYAFAEDGSWEQELRVMFVSRSGVQVSPRTQVIKHVNREVLSGSGDYIVKYVSPTVRWCIVRKADNVRIKEGFADETAAQRALLEMKVN